MTTWHVRIRMPILPTYLPQSEIHHHNEISRTGRAEEGAVAQPVASGKNRTRHTPGTRREHVEDEQHQRAEPLRDTLLNNSCIRSMYGSAHRNSGWMSPAASDV